MSKFFANKQIDSQTDRANLKMHASVSQCGGIKIMNINENETLAGKFHIAGKEVKRETTMEANDGSKYDPILVLTTHGKALVSLSLLSLLVNVAF